MKGKNRMIEKGTAKNRSVKSVILSRPINNRVHRGKNKNEDGSHLYRIAFLFSIVYLLPLEGERKGYKEKEV